MTNTYNVKLTETKLRTIVLQVIASASDHTQSDSALV